MEETGDSCPDLVLRPQKSRKHLERVISSSDFVCSCCYELMVEPTTLMCGHNFCRLCLANWSLTSKKKECPTCRQVWQGHPKVNITLRNMEHKMLGDKICTREKEVLSDEESQEKIREYDRQNTIPVKEVKTEGEGDVRTGICLSVAVILVCYLAWYWRNSEVDLLIHKPAVRWKTGDVVTWLTDMEWAEEYVDMVHQRGIDGPMILSLDEDDIKSTLDMTNPLHKRALLLAIEDVREKGIKMPSSVWEYKALYPGRCLFLLYGLKDAPRGTLLFLFIFFYEDMFLPFLHFTTQAVYEDIPFNWSQVCYLAWFWRNSEVDLLIHKPAVRWKTGDVVTWLTDMEWAEEYVDMVHQRGIDGPMILSLDEDDIKSTLDMTNPLHKRALLLAIEDVREKGIKMPSSVWEYKALYPGRCLFLLYGLKDAPRGTLLFLFIFFYEDMFLPFLHFTTQAVYEDIPFNWSQPPVPSTLQWFWFLISAVLFPYWLIVKFVWLLVKGQLWTSLFILISCPLLTITEVTFLKKYITQAECSKSAWPMVKSYSRSVMTALLTLMLCPAAPRLVSDFLFYANLYLIPIQQSKFLYSEIKHNTM